MASVKVNISLKGLESLKTKQIISKKFQKLLGTQVVAAVKRSISIGKSPVKGQGRYVGYKVDRAASQLRARIKKSPTKGTRKRLRKKIKETLNKNSLYPNSVKKDFPQKQKRPVNLALSGDMIDAIKFIGILKGIKIGLISAKQKLKDIFEAHNEGTNTAKQVPRRAILPTLPGDKFTASINRKIKNLFLLRIRELLKRINKK